MSTESTKHALKLTPELLATMETLEMANISTDIFVNLSLFIPDTDYRYHNTLFRAHGETSKDGYREGYVDYIKWNEKGVEISRTKLSVERLTSKRVPAGFTTGSQVNVKWLFVTPLNTALVGMLASV